MMNKYLYAVCGGYSELMGRALHSGLREAGGGGACCSLARGIGFALCSLAGHLTRSKLLSTHGHIVQSPIKLTQEKQES